MQKVFQPIEYVIFGIVLVSLSWAALYTIGEVLSKKHDNKLAPSETELMLKAEPKDIIYSEAYREKNGETVVKYAYLDTEVGSEGGEDISRRTPTSQTYVLEKFEDEEGKPMEKLKTVFITKPQFYRDGDEWRQIQYATTTQEILSLSGAKYHIQKREWFERMANLVFGVEPVFAVTSTFYPDPDTEANSVDGQVLATNSGAADFYTAWSGARLATGGTANDTNTTIITGSSLSFAVRAGTYSATIRRGFLLFNTAALGSGATISSAILSVWPTAKVNTDNDGSDTLGIYTSAPASVTAIVSGDYDSITYTAQASVVDVSSLSTGAYYSYTLNATGLSNISKTGATKFSLIEGHDVADNAPDDNTDVTVTISSAEEASTTQDPKLEVTYTAGVNYSFGQWFPF